MMLRHTAHPALLNLIIAIDVVVQQNFVIALERLASQLHH
jgi:hypothetical protein